MASMPPSGQPLSTSSRTRAKAKVMPWIRALTAGLAGATNRKFADSPLEGGVWCEPVSEVQFPFFEKSNPDFDGFMDHSGVVKHWFRVRIR